MTPSSQNEGDVSAAMANSDSLVVTFLGIFLKV